ncbi:MAG: ribosomal L7Ae/L30e/S12e/Gadd45 family protein [Oscillospiraceae bacterium]|nr:ribosomal L7Ae/L30e/S12e/Gadd45 family protein [Oscillospiraceae bacterium]MBQ6701248.1 ribosomal L7Ae/L30e/S12e/Gadd45 family protein [Oscillospiraceae bacterium]
MPDNRLSGFLGLCRKAGKLVFGFDMTVEAMQKGTAVSVLLSCDCSERTARNIKRIAEGCKTEVYILPLTMDEIGYAVAKRAGVLAVCDSGFSKKIKELLDSGTHKA